MVVMIKYQRFILITLQFFLVLTLNSYADEKYAEIRKIADLSFLKPQKINGVTDRVQIRRKTTDSWESASPGSKVFWEEKLKVLEKTRVQMRIKREKFDGTFVVLPDSIETEKKEAIFLFRGIFAELNQVEVEVKKGGLIVKLKKGVLDVFLHNLQSRLSGTEIAVIVDDVHGTGMIFLKEGSIYFPEYPDIKVRPMDVIQVELNKTPVVISPAFLEIIKIQRYMKFNGHDIWSQLLPFWQKPIFYVPAAAATATGGYFIYREITDKKVKGTVNVNIPD